MTESARPTTPDTTAPQKPAALKPDAAAPSKPPAPKPAPPQPAPPAPHFEFDDVVPARLRLRHVVLIAAFLVIVAIPSALAAWVSWNFAGSLRQVTASVTVQAQSLGVLGGGSRSTALRSALSSGGGAEEAAILRQMIQSEDFFRTIRDRIDLVAIWPDDLVVPYLPARYRADAPVEQGYAFWRNMVSVNLGSRDRIIRITVTAPEQDAADRLLQTIRLEAERRLNLTRTATLTAALDEAERRVADLRRQDAADREALKQFRLQNLAIDPQLLIGLNSRFRDFLRSMQATEEVLIAQTEATLGPGGRLAQRSSDRIRAVGTYLNDPAASADYLASADEITTMIAGYQPLMTEVTLSGMSLRMAEQSIIHYKRELESSKVFLTSVTGGTAATVRSFPQFWPTLLIVTIGGFTLWSVLFLTFYAIRDRK
ncbi:MAG: hypothetical protein Q4G26_07745 [Paracoccus sp. (in: a-proteobacteria)]|nr:hypothetical protein [Paracoccus sp. (in: a-proteobacteria)]